MSKKTIEHASRLLLCIVLGTSVTACAHSAGSHRPITPPNQGLSLSQYPNLHLEAKNKNEVPMTAVDRERLVNTIVRKIQVSNRFKEINSVTPSPDTLFVTVDVTNYDEGNAFLRFLLAGLGQIHIDGEVILEDRNKPDPLARYEVNKTFAWGGFYGLQTRLEHVEEGFAESVANILLEMKAE